nr:MAG TPA: cytochrome B6-F complex subunit [Bacteriophage sp.]
MEYLLVITYLSSLLICIYLTLIIGLKKIKI